MTGEERVLDVACGTGELERMLLADDPALRVVGLDLSENMLRVARDKLAAHEGASFCRGSVEALPFADGSFDLAVTASSFHYFEDPVAALREMSRVIGPEGEVVVMDWCRDFLACRLCDVALRLLDPAYRRCYGQRELREFMRAANLEVKAKHKERLRVIWGVMVATGVKPRGA